MLNHSRAPSNVPHNAKRSQRPGNNERASCNRETVNSSHLNSNAEYRRAQVLSRPAPNPSASPGDELVRRVHESAFVYDACVPPMGFWKEPAREIQALVDGGLAGASVTCAPPRHTFLQAVDTIRQLQKVVERFSEQVAICRSIADIEAARSSGRVGLVVHFQDPKPIEDDADRVETFYDLGLRVLQLSYDVQGWLGTGCAEQRDGGLTHLGTRVIEECNRLGILIDVSHCGLQTAWDALERSKDPISITHTGSYSLCAATGRNKPDDLLRAVANAGGVIGVCWFSPLLRRMPNSYRTAQATIDDVINHIDHIVNVAGPAAVGIGSDLSNLHARTLEVPAHSSLKWYRALRPDVFGEGPTDRLEAYPSELDTHAKTRNLTLGLLRRGYSEDNVRDILGGNWRRLLRQVWGA